MSHQPQYRPADDDHSSHDDKHVEHDHQNQEALHHFQRPTRTPGQLELGATEIVEGRYDVQREVVASAGIANSHFRHVWDQYRPEWLSALVAEFFGVWFYVFAGEAATATYVLTQGQQGNLTMIGFAYALGITFAIVVCAPTSGGHFHPALTLAQVVFKGFPARKAPGYIIAQLAGAFVASLMVYSIWRTEMLEMTELLTAAGKRAQVFSPEGPAGILAIFPTAGRKMSEIFANEFFGDMFLALVIWSQLDAQNVFVVPSSAPLTIGLAFAVIVWGFSAGSIVTNTARDVGARFACGVIWGKECFPSKYSALAALTNIPASFLGISIYTFFLSDTRRPPANLALMHMLEEEKAKHLLATTTHDELLDKRIERVISRGGDASNLQKRKSRM
ncbi:aquaporin-like protein [Meira miltonrushii]|uniref:Aquaporin-like protein n=1 Tax=Meira miltonrushii TaxID=1280837 RepID=A0A316VE59_9BASI|nr:aquaporin-like protein [Meira miltonrushii]PWN35790.1 aquaporin-like protein [Meira miltonrushii]